MQNNQHYPDNNTVSESGINNLHSAVVAAHAAQPFDKQAVEAAIQDLHQPPNLLATGTQDLDEVLRQDRLEYEQELSYEADLQANLRRQTEEYHLGVVATVHHLPPPPTQAPSPPLNEYLAS